VLQENLGSLIGAAFGLVFVLVNTSTAATAIAVLLRVLGVVAFPVVLVAVCRPGPATGTRAGGGGFSRRFWLVVAAEVLAIWIGLVLLNGPLHTPHAAVAWVSSVVGAHFIAMALVCRNPLFHWLGAALLGCGVVGLVLAGRGTDAVRRAHRRESLPHPELFRPSGSETPRVIAGDGRCLLGGRQHQHVVGGVDHHPALCGVQPSAAPFG
jgi:hypothetical protein